MLKDKIYGIAADFSAQSHGSTEYDKDTIYVMGSSDHEFVPMSFMMQSIPEIQGVQDLKKIGFVFSSFDFLELASFEQWYLRQFQKRLTTKAMKNMESFTYQIRKQFLKQWKLLPKPIMY